MVCPSSPDIDLAEWGLQLFAPLEGQRFPLNGFLELTERCNLSCVHCYINQPANSQAVRAAELSTQQVKSILDQMAKAGVLFLTMTGGEILLRSDFTEIYQYARRLGILVSLFTNATLITPQLADMFVDWRPSAIEITLYGATQETYERITQIPGSFARSMRGIQMLLDRGLPVTLKSMILKENLHELDALRTLVEDFGVAFRYDGMIWPRLDGSKKPLEHQISLEQMLSIDKKDPERVKEWRKLYHLYEGKLMRAEYVYSCGAGLHSFHIDSYGKMYICTMSRRYAFDILQIGFEKAWEQLGELRKLKRSKETPCQVCTIGALCSQCPGWSNLFYGDDETPVEFVCQLAHIRNKDLLYNTIKVGNEED